MGQLFAEYGHSSIVSSLDLSNFDTTTKLEKSQYMLDGIKLTSITLGIKFKLKLTQREACLTNSQGETDAT